MAFRVGPEADCPDVVAPSRVLKRLLVVVLLLRTGSTGSSTAAAACALRRTSNQCPGDRGGEAHRVWPLLLMLTIVADGESTAKFPPSASHPSRLAAALEAWLPLRLPHFEWDEKDGRHRREVEEGRASGVPRCPRQAALLHAVDGRG